MTGRPGAADAKAKRLGGARPGPSKSQKQVAGPKPMAKDSKAEAISTRNRILRAAHKEFTHVGLAGARVDRIVELAGVNKRMVYHYFGNKEGLFREMMRRSLLELLDADASAPRNLGDELVYWRKLLASNPDWIRLLLWEALAHKPKNIIGMKERRAFWKSGVDKIRNDQRTGNITPDFDADLLQLYLLALAAFPLMLPQMTELITGHTPNDPKFLQRQDAFLMRFSKLLRPKKSR